MFDTKPYEEKIAHAFAFFEEELKKVRTGRAHPGMLDGVTVEAYGQKNATQPSREHYRSRGADAADHSVRSEQCCSDFGGGSGKSKSWL